MKIAQPSNSYSQEFIELVANMLKLNASERISPKQIISKLQKLSKKEAVKYLEEEDEYEDEDQ